MVDGSVAPVRPSAGMSAGSTWRGPNCEDCAGAKVEVLQLSRRCETLLAHGLSASSFARQLRQLEAKGPLFSMIA
jgi:hypothetical protein